MQDAAANAFFGQVPRMTPAEARVARQYPGELPYDDDAPAPGMRMVKKNGNGSQMRYAKEAYDGFKAKSAAKGRLNKGLMALLKKRPELAKKFGVKTAQDGDVMNYFTNPDAGFQAGQRGRVRNQDGKLNRPEELMTYEQFFEKEKGYYPESGEFPTNKFGTPMRDKVAPASSHTYYTNIDELRDQGLLSDEGLFAATANMGYGPDNLLEYVKTDDLRTFEGENDPKYRGARYTRHGRKYDDMRGVFNVAADVDAMNKAYADYMRGAEVLGGGQPTYTAVDAPVNAQGTPTRSGGFAVQAPGSQLPGGAKRQNFGSRMYIR